MPQWRQLRPEVFLEEVVGRGALFAAEVDAGEKRALVPIASFAEYSSSWWRITKSSAAREDECRRRDDRSVGGGRRPRESLETSLRFACWKRGLGDSLLCALSANGPMQLVYRSGLHSTGNAVGAVLGEVATNRRSGYPARLSISRSRCNLQARRGKKVVVFCVCCPASILPVRTPDNAIPNHRRSCVCRGWVGGNTY